MNDNEFRSHTCDLVSEILRESGFEVTAPLRNGVVTVLDALCDYREEGRRLYPQILVAADLASLRQTLPFAKQIDVGSGPANELTFVRALKETAPLATGSWSIYIEIREERISYGLMSVESSMLSSSLDQNLCGEVSSQDRVSDFVLMRSVGNRVVHMKNATARQLIDFSLRPALLVDDQALEILLKHLVRRVDEETVVQMRNFLQRILDMSLPFSHGNLIGVVDLTPISSENIEAAAHKLWIAEGRPEGKSLEHWTQVQEPVVERIRSIAKGIFLDPPIDLNEIIQTVGQIGADATMRSYASLVRNMINNDGITIFTNDGHIMGYHIFISSKAELRDQEHGGARRRAFSAMQACSLFDCCFFKSQDGFMKAVENV